MIVLDVVFDDAYREAVCEWFREQGVDPDDVALTPIVLDDQTGVVTIEIFRRDESGRKHLDPAVLDRVATTPSVIDKPTRPFPQRHRPA